MKVHNILWISMVNIFLLLLVSILLEYANLSQRFKRLDNTMSMALETAVRTTTASEEMFSEKYQSEMTGSQGAGTGDEQVAPSTLKVIGANGEMYQGKTYVLAHYFANNGWFPDNEVEYNEEEEKFSTDTDVFKWLFGGVDSDYYSTDLEWANKYKSKLWATDNDAMYYQGLLDNITGAGESAGSTNLTDREPTKNFQKFYDEIGKSMKTKVVVKKKSGDTFEVDHKTVPVLTQMGLNLNEYNKTNSEYTADNFSGATHFGKSKSGLVDTTYYLTPYSLGVTYVPTEVLKPAMISHLEQIAVYNKTKSADDIDPEAAVGCVDTSVYLGGNSESEKHKRQDSTIGGKRVDFINDGDIEYDLSSLKVKVDYFYVDFYNNHNANIVNRIEGATPRYDASGNIENEDDATNSFDTLPERLKAKDTSYDKNGHRLVAKVSAKIKIHVPYKASILQWFRQLHGSQSENHYDIRLFNNKDNSITVDSDGIWYGCTTYTAIHR